MEQNNEYGPADIIFREFFELIKLEHHTCFMDFFKIFKIVTLCITLYALHYPLLFLTSQLWPSPYNGFLIYHEVLIGRSPLGNINCDPIVM